MAIIRSTLPRGAGIIYLGETDEPGGFEVTMNDKRVPHVTANYAFKAVLVDKPGSYRLIFRYWPAHFSTYLAVAALGLVVWITVLVVSSKPAEVLSQSRPRGKDH